jgi:pimeloyl-ACP methyl ester carboxylesterase
MAHVLFVHGLWMPGPESIWFRRRLAASFRYDVEVFRYGTVTEPLRDVLERIERHIARLDARRLHLIGHSLGGLVIRRFLDSRAPDTAPVPPGRVVMLGSPLGGSRAAQEARRYPILSQLIGPVAAAELLTEPDRPWSAPREVGMIAGVRPMGLGRFFAHFDEPNDGTVAVRETRLTGLTDHITLPVSHMGMLVSARVVAQTGAFLERGRFDLQDSSRRRSR